MKNLTGNMQICRLCAKEQQIRRGKYNKSEEWESLVKNICGYLGQQDVHWETTWLCSSCHKQAKTTQRFMRLVEVGQRKLKQLLMLKENAEEQTPLVEAMENEETDIELDEGVKLDSIAESSATTDCSDDEAENINAEFLDKVKLSKRAPCKPKHQNKVQNPVPKRRNALKLEALAPKNIAELRSSEGVVLATILESRFGNKNRSSQSFLMCKSCSSIFRKDRQFWQHFETHHNEMFKNQNIANTKNGSARRSKGVVKLRKPSAAAQESKKGSLDKNSPRFFCLQCPRSSITSCGVARHYRLLHASNKPKRVFKCEQCDITFKRNCVLQRHYAKHTGIKPFACDTCGKSFIEKHELNRHMIVHTGEKPYKCQFCDKAFAFRTTTIIHERLHTGQRPYKCSICEMRFSNPSNYKAHKNLHLKKALRDLELKLAEQQSADSEEIEPEVNSPNHTILLSQCKTYSKGAARSLLKPQTAAAAAPKTLRNSTSAEECGPAESTLKNSLEVLRVDILPTLDRTERVATSLLITLPESQQQSPDVAKPRQPAFSKFQCMYCLKNCKTNSALIKHLCTHTDDKPYQCVYCSKAYKKRSSLTLHFRTHTDDKSYKCPRKATARTSYDSNYIDESNWSVYVDVDDASSRQSYPALLTRVAGEAEDPLA